MANALQILEQRGFVKQITHPDPLRERLDRPITFYCGFDATADSLHIGHMLPLMAMANLQRAGHRAIAVMGGGTAMIGDPSGKTEMRTLITEEEIAANAKAQARQVARFIEIAPDKGLVLNNADWLMNLNYIGFLRDIGSQFSVNRMLTYECFKSRMERGLSFIEFNYMLLQSYDFLVLLREYDCQLQLGGDDQWSNIISGVDLIRRLERRDAFGLTLPLLETSDGKKMGKTEAGAVWLDANRVTPYDFFQYWRNVHDDDVARFLKLYTFIPLPEIEALTSEGGQKINQAKIVLARAVTEIVHGHQAALKAQETAQALFSDGEEQGAMPATEILVSQLNILDLLELCGLATSKSEGRRLISQGGIYIGDDRVDSIELVVRADMARDGELMLRKGKKVYHRVIFK